MYSLKFRTLNDMRDKCIASIPKKYSDAKTRDLIQYQAPSYLNSSIEDKKKLILDCLETLNKSWDTHLEQEQRVFYAKFLAKFIRPLALPRAKEDDPKEKIPFFLSLERIELLLQRITIEHSYSFFLRTIEACMDEVLILLTLMYDEKQSSHEAQTTVILLKKFIQQIVDVKPTIATLRSSGMQAISTSVLLILNHLEKKSDAKFSVFIDPATYYEIEDIFNLLFDQPLRQKGGISFISDKRRQALKFEYRDHVIYDFYIAPFESGVLYFDTRIQFVDVNHFVENQFKLRQDSIIHKDRPLFVLIDNTMSDVNEVYLPFFLMQFEKEISEGRLCVFVAHSGNKYLHLGLDKGIASLLFGFFQPETFKLFQTYFDNEILENRLGDFAFNAPTTLLTKAFIQYGREDILAFSQMIRMRTHALFDSIIPQELVDTPAYLNINNPICHATYQGLPTECKSLHNCSGTLTIRCNQKKFKLFHEVKSKIESIITTLMAHLGIHERDGFGFNETTHTTFSEETNPLSNYYIRISIGTESLDQLKHMFKYLCHFLQQTNVVMAAHLKSVAPKQSVTPPELLEACLKDIDHLYHEVLQAFRAPKVGTLMLTEPLSPSPRDSTT